MWAAGKDAPRDSGVPQPPQHVHSSLLDQGVDAAAVERLARHADPTMTLSYARLRLDSERLAIERLDLPGLPSVSD